MYNTGAPIQGLTMNLRHVIAGIIIAVLLACATVAGKWSLTAIFGPTIGSDGFFFWANAALLGVAFLLLLVGIVLLPSVLIFKFSSVQSTPAALEGHGIDAANGDLDPDRLRLDPATDKQLTKIRAKLHGLPARRLWEHQMNDRDTKNDFLDERPDDGRERSTRS